MRRERRIPFVLFVVCLVAATLPVSAGKLAAQRVVWTPFCGDGVLAPKEECDPGTPGTFDPNLGGNTCESEGYSGGELACTATCKLDRSGCVCDVGPPAAVAKTGQTGCWDQDWNPITCATGEDGELLKGVSVDPRFTDNGDGTVKDNLTGLIWLKNASCFGWQTWAEALSDANTLASGSCGLADDSVVGNWRMPNLRELQSLIDFGQIFPALPLGHPFSGVQLGHYWSSTTMGGEPSYAWIVWLTTGHVLNDYKYNYNNFVWPVRGGQ